MTIEPIREVADRVWACEQPDGPRRIRQVVVAGDARALVVDTGLPGSPAAGILPLLERLGLDVTVLLTHPDADHVGGTAAILARHPGAELLAGAHDVPLTGNPDRAIRERYDAFGADGIPFTAADAERARSRFGPAFGPVAGVADGAVLDLGGRVVELLATPGHSPGHTAAWVADAGVLAAGDAAMGAAIPDLAGDPYIPPMYAPPAAYRETVARMAALPIAVLLTGHEPVLAGPPAAAFLATSAAAADRLGELVAAALAEGRATLPVLCDRVHAADGRLPAGGQAQLAMTVDGHLAELPGVVVDPGPPRTFRRPA